MSYELLIRLADAEEAIEVYTLADVPKALRQYQADNDVRASGWRGAEVYESGRLLKRLAYNSAEIE